MKDRFEAVALSTAFLYSDKAKKKAYYVFPIKQQTLHIQYWKDMLGQAGFKESDIPGTWNEYWSFWCDKVQPGIRKATGQRVYGTGFPMGVELTDSFQSFLSWVDAYNVKLVDDNGKLLVDDPKVKQGLVAALDRLHPALYQRLHAAVVDDVERPRQQRRLPQQDDRDDARLHDLDRRQVAGRRQQRDPDRRAARRRPQGL